MWFLAEMALELRFWNWRMEGKMFACTYTCFEGKIKYLRKNIKNLLSGLYKHKMTLRLLRDEFRHSSPNQNKLSPSDSTNIFLT